MKRYKAMMDKGCDECPFAENDDCTEHTDMIGGGCIVPDPDGALVKYSEVEPIIEKANNYAALLRMIKDEVNRFSGRDPNFTLGRISAALQITNPTTLRLRFDKIEDDQ